MYRQLELRLIAAVREFLRRIYQVEIANIVVEQPPNIAFGEYALPIAFELARKLRKPPRKIAEEIVAGIGPVTGIEKFEVAGAGYINVRVNRAEAATALTADQVAATEVPKGKVLVEHSSINPNKAAHIGHLRNAILGDTFVRLLRFAGREVDVQNYIDNTGVQVADVVVGFMHVDKKSRAEIEVLAAGPHFDFYCWDLYASVSRWYAEDKQNLAARSATLHAIEEGDNETAGIAELVSIAVLRRHLETMERLDIEYDFLPRESEILHLHFWDAAFTKLKEAGVLTYESEGKNKGCWVMRRAGTAKSEIISQVEVRAKDLQIDTYESPKKNAVRVTHVPTGVVVSCDDEDSQHKNREKAMMLLRTKLLELPADQISEEDQKVIVRSNGTVGYVGKDIAYHMWKFGLLGRDFSYRKFFRYPNAHDCWISTTPDEPSAAKDHPHFGDVAEIYNVIDARQSEAQNTVIEALRGLGHDEAADRYTHFSYEMVALTPRCAAELGYELSDEEKARPWIEVSGRKGFGVKADDLLDALIASAQREVDSRHPEVSDPERAAIASQIAIGALRFFMLKFTKPSVIAFDFKEALSFEGETGPYAQYAVVRATNIFRKGGFDPDAFLSDPSSHISPADFAKYLDNEEANSIWELWLAASKTSYIVGQCIATTEPAYLAKHVFQLAQLFNTFYHQHPILAEPDESRKRFLLTTAVVVRRELIRILAIMGITAPPVM
ncbi:MAG: arginine--tRNA ligase [Terriglobales bacterium]